MTTKTATKQTPAEPSAEPKRLTQQMIPRDLEGVPPAVAEAAAKVRATAVREEQLAVELRELMRAVREAEATDRAAAHEAERASEPVPAATAPAARAALEDVERRRKPAQSLARQAAGEQNAVIAEHRDEWRTAAFAQADELLEELRRHVAELEVVADRLGELGAVVHALDGFDAAGGFFAGWPTAGHTAQRRADVRDGLMRQFAARGRLLTAPANDFPGLLAMLEVLGLWTFGEAARDIARGQVGDA